MLELQWFAAKCVCHQDVIVVQQVAYATQAPVAEDALIPAYSLQTVSEYETSRDSFVRISKVKTGS